MPPKRQHAHAGSELFSHSWRSSNGFVLQLCYRKLFILFAQLGVTDCCLCPRRDQPVDSEGRESCPAYTNQPSTYNSISTTKQSRICSSTLLGPLVARRHAKSVAQQTNGAF